MAFAIVKGAILTAAVAIAAAGGMAEAQAPSASKAPAAPAAARPQRLALVIGNATYKESPLANPLNDAADMARALEAVGFKVIRRENATLREMHLALREFGDQLGRNATGVFYFAGHGLQVRGRNYLVPVDADIAREDEVAFAAMDLSAVMEKLDSAKNPVNLVILDACRNNPFGNRFVVTTRGLAQMEAPPGTLIAFATAPGSVAADGRGRNGLYTGHLLANLGKAGAGIEETFKAVRAAVRKDSSGLQVPWESTSLETEVVFKAAPPPPVAAAPARAGGAMRNISPYSPPSYVAGDRWTYKVTNQLDGSDRVVTPRVAKVDGNDVHWASEEVSDLLGNFTRTRNQNVFTELTPHYPWYVFPLRVGAVHKIDYSAKFGNRIDDGRALLAVEAEEEVSTPAGRFKAIRIKRTVEWHQRGNPDNKGTHEATYWYHGGVKRYVLINRSAHHKGKLTYQERWELTAFATQ